MVWPGFLFMPQKLTFCALILLLFLTACQPVAPVASSPVPTPTLLPPLARQIDISPNAIMVPIPIDPPSFNAYINDTGYEELIGELVFGALAELGPDGRYYPELALDIPTRQNGGLSANGLTVTWHLRPGILWSDGQPFTAADVRFTWDALKQSGIYAPGFDLITEVETPDDLTVVLHYSKFFPNYRLQFGGEGTGIFPAHQCGQPDKMLQWDCNFNPVSLGPFVLAEWEPGRRLIFTPNPHYWIPDRPLTDQLIFTIEADQQVRERQLKWEDAQLDLWVEEPQLTNYEKEDNLFVFQTTPARFMLQLIPNLSRPGSADAAQPNPLLADLRVRQAIRHAINISGLNETVFNNRALPADTELTRNGCAVTPYAFSPETARALLTQAGWTDQNEDDVRECHGCQFAEEGTPLEFDAYYYAEFGDQLGQMAGEIEKMLFDVGITIHPKPAEGVDLWATWADKGLESRGNFNLDLWDDGYYGIDPTDYLYDLYDPRAIPTQNDPEAGFNVMRYRNPELAPIFDQLYTPLDDADRTRLFCRMAVILYRDLPTIPLLALPDYYVFNTRLQGISPQIYDTITWNAGDWRLNPPEEKP